MDFDTKRVGNVTEIQCMTSFIELGYNVSIPFGDCERYDFIADYKGNLLRIQCKTARPSEDDSCIEINGRSNKRVKGKCTHRQYTKEEVDYMATYYKGKCYLIPVEEVGSAKKLRLQESKNNQMERVNFAKDYELEKVLQRID